MILDYGRLDVHALQAEVAHATSAAIPLWMGAGALAAIIWRCLDYTAYSCI